MCVRESVSEDETIPCTHAECEAVDAYVEDLEKLVDLVFSKYSIEADMFEHESLEDFEKYMELANACHKSINEGLI